MQNLVKMSLASYYVTKTCINWKVWEAFLLFLQLEVPSERQGILERKLGQSALHSAPLNMASCPMGKKEAYASMPPSIIKTGM